MVLVAANRRGTATKKLNVPVPIYGCTGWRRRFDCAEAVAVSRVDHLDDGASRAAIASPHAALHLEPAAFENAQRCGVRLARDGTKPVERHSFVRERAGEHHRLAGN